MIPLHIVFIDCLGDAQIVKIPDNAMSVIVYTKNNHDITCEARFANRLPDKKLNFEDYNQ